MEENKNEKKISRKVLTFYIVGLFSIAIVLILISYIAQVRSSQQLETLSNQLSQTQTQAQGATQKMETLQSEINALSAEVDTARRALGINDQTPLTDGVETLQRKNELLGLLVTAAQAARGTDPKALTDALAQISTSFSAEELTTAAEGGLLEDTEDAAYRSLLQQAEQPK